MYEKPGRSSEVKLSMAMTASLFTSQPPLSIHMYMFGPYTTCFATKVKGKVGENSVPSVKIAYIPMGFQWAQVFKDSFAVTFDF